MSRTQTDRVLSLLRLRGEDGLTPMEALEKIGTFRLAARISDAKELIGPDEMIVTERLTVGDKTVARYVLRQRPVGAVTLSLWGTETPR